MFCYLLKILVICLVYWNKRFNFLKNFLLFRFIVFFMVDFLNKNVHKKDFFLEFIKLHFLFLCFINYIIFIRRF